MVGIDKTKEKSRKMGGGKWKRTKWKMKIIKNKNLNHEFTLIQR
jgi:hypothetical protein